MRSNGLKGPKRTVPGGAFADHCIAGRKQCSGDDVEALLSAAGHDNFASGCVHPIRVQHVAQCFAQSRVAEYRRCLRQDPGIFHRSRGAAREYGMRRESRMQPAVTEGDKAGIGNRAAGLIESTRLRPGEHAGGGLIRVVGNDYRSSPRITPYQARGFQLLISSGDGRTTDAQLLGVESLGRQPLTQW